MRRQVAVFTGPRTVEVIEEELAPPGPGQALVATRVSAISAGTELMIYRGEAPRELAADETIGALAGTLAFPIAYGYAAVGRVIALGPEVAPEWQGRLVFSFQPHASHFVATVNALHPVPPGLTATTAAMLPSMETAVTFLLDGAPLIGERVAVLGQGVVGLLTTALLARLPLGALATADRHPRRRELGLRLGARYSLDPGSPVFLEHMRAALQARAASEGADLVYELSGSPAALNQALALTGYSGRVVIGSWYGDKPAALDLGGRFHRSRTRLIASQVSRIAPELSGRWTSRRRLEVAWRMLAAVRLDAFITHRLPQTRAADAYALLDSRPDEALQIMLVYPEQTE